MDITPDTAGLVTGTPVDPGGAYTIWGVVTVCVAIAAAVVTNTSLVLVTRVTTVTVLLNSLIVTPPVGVSPNMEKSSGGFSPHLSFV